MLPSPRVPWLNPGWAVALVALAWLLGLGLQMQQAQLWAVSVYAGFAAAGALLTLAVVLGWALGLRRSGQAPRRAIGLQTSLACLAAALLAVALAGWRANARLAERLDPALEGLDLRITGVVAGLPHTGLSGVRFVFEVEQAQHLGRPVRLPPLISLGWYNNFRDEAPLDDARLDLRAGQRWRLAVRLKRPHATLNPDVFDAELMWFEQGIGATGYVRVPKAAGQPGASVQRLADGVAHPVERLRQSLRDAIFRQVPDPRVAGVLAALVVGDQSAIEREDWELFRQTGIAHLVSISGVHVTMFAWAAAGLVAWGWRRVRWQGGRQMLWLPAPVAGRWAGLALATAYAMLAGWGVPAQRTVVMLGVVGLLRSTGRRWPWPLVLLAAAVVVTVLDPWALMQPGFWLSFMAVGLLMASGPEADPAAPSAGPQAGRVSAAHGQVPGNLRGHLRGNLRGPLRRHLRGHLRAQVVATLGLAPLSLVFFQQVSVVGFVANLVAIPLVTLLITPLALAGAVLPGLWAVAGLGVQALVGFLGWLALWPAAVYVAPVAPAWAIACGLLGAVLGVLPVPWAVRGLALPLLLPLLWPPVHHPAPGRFDLLVADVGQGTAVLVRTRHHLLVYDTGPQYSPEADAGQRVLLPLLRNRGESRIDLLMLSHRDADHVGGATSLLAGWPVAALQSSLNPDHPLVQAAAQRGVPHQRCDAGQQWDWDGVHFSVLHPTAAEHAGAQKSNAVSCVLRVQDSTGRSALLTGDIEAPQEAALVDRLGPALASTLLLVPHHGSRTSSTPAFLDAVAPRTAVVQAGYRSRYGHPAPDVLARYAERGIDVVRTDECGAWLWQDGMAACTRDVRRRYWHGSGQGPRPGPAPAGGAEVANPAGRGAQQR